MASAVIAATGGAICSLTLSPSVSGRCNITNAVAPLSLHSQRSAFSGRSLAPPFASRTQQQRRSSRFGVRAYDPLWDDPEPLPPFRGWPDKDFVAETLDAFPAKAIADVEEARVLYENGYNYVDVRPALELQEVGKVPNSVNVPLFNSKRVYSKEHNKKIVKKEENKDFLQQFEKKFPDKSAKLLVACSDTKTYSLQALEMLDEAGYQNLVALQGGYYAWFRVFDNKLNRRYTGEYQEEMRHDAGSAGIHASGAGFDMVDKIEQWVPPSYD